MKDFENEIREEGALSFRELVGGLIKESTLFPSKEIGRGETLDILDAIEKNEVSLYVPEGASDRMLDAVHCLTAIYDELSKKDPDQDFTLSTVEQLKEYL